MTADRSHSPLSGRVALVTGSGRNIGRAIALSLAAQGARVVVNGHSDAAAVDGVVAEIEAQGGEAAGVMADVGRDEDVARLVRSAVDRFGSLDIVVSNVGIRRKQPFLEITPEQWDEVLRTNLSAAFYLARHAIPHMQARRWGRLVFISGFDGFWGQVTHRAHNITAKAGLHGLAMALAREFGPDNITANTVAPGAIDTVRDWSQYTHQQREQLEKEIPLGRYGKVEEVAAACELLCAERGGFISGQVIHVNGGHYMY
ncbi:SDR family NAD(P)-dependent oxidoreductase [Ramlibacter rhizophilus]|uniref:3-oxoacyl-ACP reductase FabG n=1 Tax=Ramlibacter rhizophilus TaxID=1781167 RepID=A0A4Z0BYJ5_9BURK|nr:3-oxoacyl-ACP reductase family protein [Ramlibacter rhizophilus]TFZ04407.1 3-oxoacyl-ACP reductase FabG [Ramlibacter rhizophilus]